MRIYRETCK